MNKKLFLHIGAHKTASSLLQTALKSNQEVLKKNQLDVVFRAQVINTKFQALLDLLSKGETVNPQELQASLKEVLSSKTLDKCLVTNEDLFSSIKINDFYQNIKYSLANLKAVAKDCDIKVILYVRNQADYVESVYTQYIHLGRPISFDEYRSLGNFENLSWYRVVCDIAEAVGKENVIVKPFETLKHVSADDFFRDFMSTIEVANLEGLVWPSNIETSRGANRSYSKLAIEIANLVNPLLDKKERQLLRKFLQENFSTATHERAQFLSLEEREELKKIHSSDNKKLFEIYIPKQNGKLLGYF
ncbi:hypothetical protein [Billgrantia desiderata]|uniref:hypothetical protein n=1 Tax=Billgrantia desiderata TaxID=52021 RepID=UPI001120FF74|nr:hypothetical protein [Halomonas desiderata]